MKCPKKLIITKDEWISLFGDCMGYSRDEAIEEYEDYRGILSDWIEGRGNEEELINQAKRFLGR